MSDRIWFKVKTGDQRAVVTELSSDERAVEFPANIGAWWIGTGGRRQADSPQRDFYQSIARECMTGKTVSSIRLLPTEWDWKRLTAEQAVAWRREMKRIVVRLISMSLRTGKLAVVELRNHRIKALVRAENGLEAYLAIVAEGVPDPKMFALLLGCVPGVNADDRQPEPSPLAEMQPNPGEVIWSTLFPSKVASTILGVDAD